MATFKAQVQGITSLSIGTTPTDDELSQFLVDGTKEVANRIITIRPDEIGKFTTSTNDASDAGIPLTGQVISVVREHDDASILRNCSSISPGGRYAASDSTSLNYRSKYNPGFYILDGKIHTVPASAGSDNDAIVTQVYYAVNQGHSSSSIDNFPDEYEYLVVLYASLRSIHAAMGAKTTPTAVTFLDLPVMPVLDALATISFSETNALSLTAIIPNSLSLTEVTYTGISDVDVGGIVDVQRTTIDITGATQPSYNSGATIGEVINPTLSITDLSVIAAPPDVPSVPNFTFTVGTSLPTYVTPTTTINGTGWSTAYPDQQANITIAMAAVTTALDAVYALGLAKLTLDPFSLTAVVPDTPTVPNFTISPGTSLPTYTKLITAYDPGVPTDLSTVYDWSQSVTDIGAFTGITAVAPDTPSLTEVAFTGAGDGHTAYAITDSSAFVTSLADISSGTIAVLTGTAPTYLPPAPPDRPDMDGAITNQDIEMLSANAQQYQTDLGAYQAEMADAQNTFNEENAEYQANVQKDIAKAQADNAAVLQDLQKNLTIAQSDAQVENTVRAANQAADLQNAVTDMQRIINDNTRLLSYWQQEISQYQAEVGVEVQDYQQKLSKYSQEVQTELTVWQQKRQGELSEHSQKIARFQAIMSDELNEFNTELQKYQAEVQTLLQEAQYEQQAENAANLQQYQAELGTYGAEVNSETQAYTQYLAEQQQEFTSAVTTYQTLTQTAQAFSSEIQMRLAPRSVEISEYQSRVGDSLNSFNTELQKYQAELQKELQEAQYEQQAKHAAGLQQYQAEVAGYGAEVNTEVQEWQANTNKDLQIWQQSNAIVLQEHSQKMQDALNLFNEENVEYQAEVQAVIQQAQIDSQESLQNMQKSLQIAIRNEDRSQEHQLQESMQDVQALIADNQREIGRYQAELGAYTAQINTEVQEYTAQLQTDMKTMEGISANNQNLIAKFQALVSSYSSEVQTYQTNASSEIAKYQAELQSKQAEYQWLQDQYSRIKAEYDSAFIALAPPGQGSNEQEQPRA